MAGYVRHENGDWVELRVHGVSGTPPESMLGHPNVRRVSGDASSGFYRRVWQAESVSADNDEDVLEAYSWGGLTSGGRLRVLWLLLIPFLLVNVAFYARPTDRPGRLRDFGELIQRLFALTITATLVMATVNVSMDYTGWQCNRPLSNSCDPSWLVFLSWDWLDSPGRRIALTAALPLAVIALLWRLAVKTWCATEFTPVPDAPRTGPQCSPLENRRMWNSAKPVRRLRAVHITGALALVGIFALAPFARDWPSLHAGADPGWPIVGAQVLLAAVLLLGLASVALACLPSMSDRPGSKPSTAAEPTGAARPADERRTALISRLPWVAVAVDAVALGWIAWAVPKSAGLPDHPRTPLPWLSGAIHISYLAQVVFLVAMCVVLRAMRGPRRSRESADPRTPAAWHGYATAVLMLFGSAMSGAYAGAMVLAVAHLLGKPKSSVVASDSLVTSPPYFWAIALAVFVAAAALSLALCGWVSIRRAAKHKLLPQVRTAYQPELPVPDAGPDAHAAAADRSTAISRAWATATVDDTFRRLAGWFVGITVALLVAATLGYLFDRSALTHSGFLRLMANVGDWLVGLFAASLLYLGRRAYQNDGTRRIVGVIWDLGTFWPRAAHPLAPPCYAERAVPELLNRVEFLTATDRVILSCHSQGSIIGAAVVNQLTFEQSQRVALLTYGAPLRRLYARFFPVYFGERVLHNTEAFLLGGRDRPDPAAVPWRNLYRRSDPIGGPVFDDGVIDRCLLDPAFAKPAGDISYPPTYGHSGYPDDPQWTAAVHDVKRLRLAADRAGPVIGADLGSPVPTATPA